MIHLALGMRVKVVKGAFSIYGIVISYRVYKRLLQTRNIATCREMPTLVDTTYAMYRESIPTILDSLWPEYDPYELNGISPIRHDSHIEIIDQLTIEETLTHPSAIVRAIGIEACPLHTNMISN